MRNGQQYIIEFNGEVTVKCFASENTEIFSQSTFAKGQKLEVTFIKHKEQDYLFYTKSYGWFEIPDSVFESVLVEEFMPLHIQIKSVKLLTGRGPDRISFVIKTPTFEPDHYDVSFDCNVPKNKGIEFLKNMGIYDYEIINIKQAITNFSEHK